MGLFEESIYTALIYLPYALMLISIVFLFDGFYLKKHMKSGKRYFIISFECLIMAIFIFLIPVILLIIIKIRE
ncbi:MAG: hypothetical protein K0R54_5286 [Clostridiaceae bacterium]|jgi:hypothetical protein|nr:hypothetical protein [Clostridiaceae bacterium]